jgi:hypothetical protein
MEIDGAAAVLALSLPRQHLRSHRQQAAVPAAHACSGNLRWALRLDAIFFKK